MRAAAVHQVGEPLVIEDMPTKGPGPGEVLVRIEASGPEAGRVDARRVFDLRA